MTNAQSICRNLFKRFPHLNNYQGREPMLKKSLSNSLVILHTFILITFNAYATDLYDPANNQLRISQVVVGTTIYSDVMVNLGNILSVKGGPALSNYDTYNPTLNELTIPSVTMSGVTYTNITVNVAQVLGIGSFKEKSQLPLTLANYEYSRLTPNSCENNSDSDVFSGITFFTLHPINSKPWGCNIVNSIDGNPVFNQSKAIRIEVRPGDCSGNSGFNDCVNDRSRHEIQENLNESTNGKLITYSEKIFIPSQPGFLATGTNGYPLLVLNQITATDSDNFKVLLYLKLGKGNKLQIRIHEELNFSKIKEFLISDNPFDKWLDIKYVLKSSDNLNGNIKVYLNSNLAAEYTGITLPSATGKNSLRLGIYNSGISYITQTLANQVVYFDAIEKTASP